MDLRVLAIVPRCYTWDDGDRVSAAIRSAFRHGEKVSLSFQGVDNVPSSFVNGAFVSLLKDYPYDYLRANLNVCDSTRQINDMIRNRVDFERKRCRRIAA